MLRGFNETLIDFIEAPDKLEKVVDMILDFKIRQADELKKR